MFHICWSTNKIFLELRENQCLSGYFCNLKKAQTFFFYNGHTCIYICQWPLSNKIFKQQRNFLSASKPVLRTDKKLDIKYCWRASSFRMTLCRNSFLFTSAKFKMEPISLNYQNGEINIIMSDCLPWAFWFCINNRLYDLSWANTTSW